VGGERKPDEGCDDSAANLDDQPIQGIEAGVDSFEAGVDPVVLGIDLVEPGIDLVKLGIDLVEPVIHFGAKRCQLRLRFDSTGTKVCFNPSEAVIDPLVQIVEPIVCPSPPSHRLHVATVADKTFRSQRKLQ
jgi:hypothetical protein